MHRVLRSIFRLDEPLASSHVSSHTSGTPKGRHPRAITNTPVEDSEILTHDYLHSETLSGTKIKAKGAACRVHRSCTVEPSSCASNRDPSSCRGSNGRCLVGAVKAEKDSLVAAATLSLVSAGCSQIVAEGDSRHLRIVAGGLRSATGGAPTPRCNCNKRSKCLKLYCECVPANVSCRTCTRLAMAKL